MPTQGSYASLESRIDRFPSNRQRLAAFAAISERLAQLACAHPVLFFTLANGIGTQEHRTLAIRLAAAGCRLAEISDAARVPYCFRHLPPEACGACLTPSQWSAVGGERLRPYLPRRVEHSAAWLRTITLARRADNEAFALWLARETRSIDSGFLLAAVPSLALFSWYSRHADLAPGQIITRRWSPALRLNPALRSAHHWLRRLSALGLQADPIDPWLAPGTHQGYALTPLLTRDDLLEEGESMDNCVASFGPELSANICRLFSVRSGGARVATLEIRWDYKKGGFRIRDLKGPSNDDCPLSVWKAVIGWLALPQNSRQEPPSMTQIAALDDVVADYRAATALGDPNWARGLVLAELIHAVSAALTRIRTLEADVQ